MYFGNNIAVPDSTDTVIDFSTGSHLNGAALPLSAGNWRPTENGYYHVTLHVMFDLGGSVVGMSGIALSHQNIFGPMFVNQSEANSSTFTQGQRTISYSSFFSANQTVVMYVHQSTGAPRTFSYRLTIVKHMSILPPI
jgi:hypothetical protein